MNQRPSRTFIVAGVIIGLSLFVLLAMLFYGPTDYTERSEQIAGEDGLRFHIASIFFGSFGIGAYVGWLIILTWAIIVFFRESVGELALRAVSLGVVVISGAALAELLGSGHLGGDLGYAIGSVLEASLGTVLGVLLIGAVFGVSVVLATDYGFHTYYKEAKHAIAVVEEEPVVTEEPSDLVKRIDKAASEVDEEIEEDMPAAWPPARQETEDEPIRVETKPPIEVEEFDDVLDVLETPDADPEAKPEAETDPEILVPEDDPGEDAELLIESEPVEAAELMEEAEPMAEAGSEVDLAVPEVLEADLSAELPVEAAEMEIVSAEEDVLAEEVEVERREEATAEEPDAAPVVEELLVEKDSPTARLASALDTLLGPAEEEEPEPEIAVVEFEPEPAVEEAAPEPAVEEAAPEPKAEEAAPEPEAVEFETAPLQDPMLVEVPTVLIDDEIYVSNESLHELAEEQRREDPITEEMPAVVEAPAAEPEIEEVEFPDPIVISDAREREVIEELIEEAEEDVVEELVDVSDPADQSDGTFLPFMEDEERKGGMLRSFFRRKKTKGGKAPDPLLTEAASLVIDRGKASVVLLQRRLDIGHTRASRIIESLESEGLVGPLLESGSREVMMTRMEWETRA